jgi:hypothetical protein
MIVAPVSFNRYIQSLPVGKIGKMKYIVVAMINVIRIKKIVACFFFTFLDNFWT